MTGGLIIQTFHRASLQISAARVEVCIEMSTFLKHHMFGCNPQFCRAGGKCFVRRLSRESSCRRGSADVSQSQVEATRQPAAAVTRRLQGDPDQTGQQNQRCSQEEAEEGRGERGGGGGGGTAGGGHTVEEKVEVFVTGARKSTLDNRWRRELQPAQLNVSSAEHL